MHRALIVARMKPDAASDIAGVFADSDHGELPDLIGVTGRSLFQFGDVYLHLIESERPPGPEVARHADHPEFRDISRRLSAYVSAYDPATWRSPKDAMAYEFYRWERRRPREGSTERPRERQSS
ncbi:TcmI family type II polyketide cyclase [Streptomyces sp. SAJ15]|uniref:TcmI family type II polyketide cyclase n=1 Tax=Streptomyces sp. SAJ15 TaxID=2011095 RepID=UPI001186BA2D|nr:TcmI family type II polyketide cyclase [Streptomyces sp. SAJ15]TVL93456.1 polyketide synthase [Streptomyces sp. SAJ15]